MQLGMSGDAGRKVLRIGLLNPVATLDPRAPQDLLSTLLLAQIYETPYAAPSGAGDPAAVLFSEQPKAIQEAAAPSPWVIAARREGVEKWEQPTGLSRLRDIRVRE